ncbi:MAG: hypothetical protein E4H40_06700, partial [Candidatus Brocadiia bacterium]
INGEKIDDAVILAEAERLRPEYEKTFAETPEQQREGQLAEWSKENVIERVVLRQYVEKTVADVGEAEIEKVMANLREQYSNRGEDFDQLGDEEKAGIRQDVEKQMKFEVLMQELYEKIAPPGSDEIAKFYKENIERFKTPEQIRVSHIVKHIGWQGDQAAAEKIIGQAHDELQKGALFESTALKYSDCPDKGGDLGDIVRGQMVEEFDDVVFNLSPGQVSDIFRTRFGFHIAKVYSRKQSVVQSLDQVRDVIINRLTEQKHIKALEDLLDELKSKAQIRQE